VRLRRCVLRLMTLMMLLRNYEQLVELLDNLATEGRRGVISVYQDT
jgi:hypothetical protein